MPLEHADENPRIPYQYPNLPDALPEIVIPKAIPEDDRLWVPQAENVWFRPLCLNRSQGYWMNLLKVRRAGVLSRHRHPQSVHGFVLKGRWHYLEHDWMAEEGSYVFEPPGETHTLVVPEGVEDQDVEPLEPSPTGLGDPAHVGAIRHLAHPEPEDVEAAVLQADRQDRLAERLEADVGDDPLELEPGHAPGG